MKIYLVIAAAALAGLMSVVVLPYFSVMPWERSKPPEISERGSAARDLNIVIRKSARTLELFDGGDLIRSYKMSLGFAPVGTKEKEGDGKTPEGEYYVFTKNPESRFYLSLGISYPGIEDARRGMEQGLIGREEYDAIADAIGKRTAPPQHSPLGGEIYIHGGGILTDWTQGCIALRNEEIKEIFDIVPVGTRVTIVQ